MGACAGKPEAPAAPAASTAPPASAPASAPKQPQDSTQAKDSAAPVATTQPSADATAIATPVAVSDVKATIPASASAVASPAQPIKTADAIAPVVAATVQTAVADAEAHTNGVAAVAKEAAPIPAVPAPVAPASNDEPSLSLPQSEQAAKDKELAPSAATPTESASAIAADKPSLTPADLQPAITSNNSSGNNDNNGPITNVSSTSSGANLGTWDKARMLFQLTRAEELLNDLHDLKYIGAGGYGKVFKAVWRSAPVAVKLVPSHSPELFKSSSYKEALLCKELCHPNIVQTYETRCAQLTEEFVHSILAATTPPGQTNSGLHMSGNGAHSYTSQEFVSGDGFGLPSPVPDMVVRGKTLPEAAAKWKDILFTTGAKAGDYLTVIIMDFCDYGSLVRPIVKGMFRPFSASGSDREARVRYRALLRTAKEIAQGLEHLHYLRVVHGDLKPGNVLLKGSRVDVRGFNAQVIDFGLSHMVNNSNPHKVSKAGGTLVYAAPEVFSGVVGKAADVYSLGIILWEMVTGSQPYKDLNEGQIVLGVQKHGLRPTWPPGQLPQLQELYEKCVAQDADVRPKAKEVVSFLTQIEMDLRAELRAAHKAQQQAQMPAPHLQPLPVPQQQQQQRAQGPAGGPGGGAPDQAQLLAAHQQAMQALQQQQQQQQQQQVR